MKTMFEDVAEFNSRFNLPVAACAVVGPSEEARTPRLLNQDEYVYRLRFLQEELAEFMVAHGEENLEKAADALTDLAYVVLGTAHYMGLPFDNIWDEVHQANMKKERPVTKYDEHPRGPREHLRKPDGWKAPDIVSILCNAGWTP